MRVSPEDLGRWLLKPKKEPQIASEFKLYHYLWENASDRTGDARNLPFDTDPHSLEQCGWGVVWTASCKRRLKPSLEPLLARRRKQAGKRYQELISAGPRESAAILLARSGETLGTIRPKKVPYFLLIIGGPEEIPFEVQYHLSLNHAVGRLAFPNEADYGIYANHVCGAEEGKARAEPIVGVFSVENDHATRLFGDRLITPLIDTLHGYRDDWGWIQYRKRLATRAHLVELLSEPAPSLLIVSGHGQSLPAEREDQKIHQGALLCEPEGAAAVIPENYALRGDHLASSDALLGQVCFLFSCYAAGTPVFDSYPFRPKESMSQPDLARPVLAQRPFIASLPQALLKQGSLGIVGNVDRSWSLSFAWAETYQNGSKTSSFELEALATLENSLKMLLYGERLGHALRSIHQRYAFLSGHLAESLHRLLQLAGQHSEEDLERLGYLWTGVNDARNLILLGDPAVYLRGQRSTPDFPVRLPYDLIIEVKREAEQLGMTNERWIEELVRHHLRLGKRDTTDVRREPWNFQSKGI